MILNKYLAFRFVSTFTAVFTIFLIFTLMVNFIEHLRMFRGRDFDLLTIAKFVFLITPSKISEIIPLITVISSVAMFLSLTRSSELVIIRAAGRSAISFLISPTLSAVTLGVFIVTIFNPIVAGTSQKYELEFARINGLSESLLRITKNGIWLRQTNDNNQTLIHAKYSSLDGTLLQDVTFFIFDHNGHPLKRVEAQNATLQKHHWTLKNTVAWNLSIDNDVSMEPVKQDFITIPTNLTLGQIQDSFGVPSAMSIWKLPRFIQQLEMAGFSARRHVAWFQQQIALPAFLAAVTLIGAAFTIRPSRLQNSGLMVLCAILCGFGAYFIRNFARLLAEDGQLPASMAAWVPPIAFIGFALALILQKEDG